MSKLTDVTEKSVLRGLVLKIAGDAEPLGAGTEVIHAAVKRYGYAPERADIESACNYLEGKGLVRMEHLGNAVLKINRDVAHITPAGTDVLEGTLTVEGMELPE